MSSQDNDPRNQRSRYSRREPEQPSSPVRRYPRPESSSSSSYSGRAQSRPPSSSRYRTAPPARQPGQRPSSRQQTAYANPELSHDMNVTQQSEVVVFFKLLAKISFGIVFLFLLIYFSFRLMTPYIPYSFEEKISQNFIGLLLPEEEEKYEGARAELQILAEQLAAHMGAPQDMPLHIHISSDRDLNAFATLGGHIIINKGTIENVKSENALAMVLAHEVAHVKNRDPLTSLGTSTLFSLLLTIVTGTDSGLTFIGSLTELSFSRQQESQADMDALVALRAYYGHTQGADEFFSLILTKYGSAAPPAFLSSHPDTQNRLNIIRQDQTRISTFKDLIPLSANLQEVQNHKPERRRRP